MWCVYAQEEVARAREAFMLRRWASILAQVKAAGLVEGVAGLAAGGNDGVLGWRRRRRCWCERDSINLFSTYGVPWNEQSIWRGCTRRRRAGCGS